ncbi:chorismate mutase [Sciscionella marina]|uniref:chorismate mutase n=1 Tax=Sciscionella marina TaxID=508770 RepID=UPI00036C78F0|nr:chorismate mutase [Sciscionella marina]
MERSRLRQLLRRAAVGGTCLTLFALLATPSSAAIPPDHTLLGLADAVTDRVEVADLVAAAKFPDGAITDAARERQVLEDAANRARELGLDQNATVAFFRDQIEAAKVVEYGLFARWTAHPELAPKHRPDLATEVRPKIDALTKRLLDELAVTVPERATPACQLRVRIAFTATGVAHRLDPLHARGQWRATRSVCTTGDL